MRNKATLKLPATKSGPRHKKLIAAYNGLPPLDQTIVHILSVIYGQTARTHVVNSLKKLAVDNADAKKYTVSGLNPIFSALVDSGIVEQDGNYFKCCGMLMEPICRLLVDRDRFDDIATAVQSALPAGRWHDTLHFSSYEEFVREIRIGLYRRDIAYIRQCFDSFKKNRTYSDPKDHPYAVIFEHSFDSTWILKNLPQELHPDIAKTLLDVQNYHEPVDRELFCFLTACLASTEKGEYWDSARIFLAEQSILEGRFEAAEKMIAGTDGKAADLIRGSYAFLADKNEAAIAHYETAMQLLKKGSRKRKIYFNNLSGIFYILALLKSGTPQHTQQAKTYTHIAGHDDANRFISAFGMLNRLIAVREGDPDALESITRLQLALYAPNTVSVLIEALAIYWADKRQATKSKKRLQALHAQAEKSGYKWLAAESASLLARLSKKEKKYSAQAEAFFKQNDIQSIVDLIRPESKWKQALNALIGMQKDNAPAAETEKSSRLVWLVDFNEKYQKWGISPREQVQTGKGAWSKGRKIALKRLYYESASFDFLTSQDRTICACLEEHSVVWHGYPEVSYYFKPNALIALAGHPLLFSDDSDRVPINIVTGRPELLVNTQPGGKFQISFTHAINTNGDVQLIRETPTRFKVIETGEDVTRIAKIIGKGLKVPAVGKSWLLEAVDSVSTVLTVHSQIDGIGGEAQEIPADPTPNIHLRPFGPGLKLDVLVQPFAGQGPCFRPAEGGATVVADIDGQQLRTKRELDQERQLADKVMAAGPMLAALGQSYDESWEWELSDPQDCLEILLELQAQGKAVILKWPEGEHFRVHQQADMNRFYMSVKKQQDWFAISGELKLDDGLVLSMEQLLDLVKDAPGRFVRMEDGRFLALTRSFRKRLAELSAYSKKSGKNRRFHPLAALSLEELADHLGGFRSDKHWKAHLKRLNDARSLKPEIPTTFKAELRDYQAEGFNWLFRLSHWGAGGVPGGRHGPRQNHSSPGRHPDQRSPRPVSGDSPHIGRHELGDGSPTLCPNTQHRHPGQRKSSKNSRQPGPFDLLLVTYGLLQQEKVAEMLARIRFKTIVLDEAQAIKNMTTKRSQAAMTLNGDFKLITTGTPIENHLGGTMESVSVYQPRFARIPKGFQRYLRPPDRKKTGSQCPPTTSSNSYTPLFSDGPKTRCWTNCPGEPISPCRWI